MCINSYTANWREGGREGGREGKVFQYHLSTHLPMLLTAIACGMFSCSSLRLMVIVRRERAELASSPLRGEGGMMFSRMQVGRRG